MTIDEGDTNLDPDKLRSTVAIGPGEDYDATKIDKTVETMTIEAGKAGYAFAKVEPEIQRDPANHTLSVTYKIQEGPRTYIERIDIVGNIRTRDEVIRRELRLYEGDAYNRVLVDRARRRLTALDFFDKIDFKEDPGSAPDKVDSYDRTGGEIDRVLEFLCRLFDKRWGGSWRLIVRTQFHGPRTVCEA